MLEDGFTFLRESLDDSDETMEQRGSTRARSRQMAKSLSRLSVALSEIDHDSDFKKQLNKKQCLVIKMNDPDSAIKISARITIPKIG